MNNFLCCFVSQFRPEGDECIMASAPPISPKCIVYHPQQHKWAEERAEKPNILLCKCTRLQAMNHNPISSCNFQPFQFPIKHHFLQLQCFQFAIKDTQTQKSFGIKVKLLTIITIITNIARIANAVQVTGENKKLFVWQNPTGLEFNFDRHFQRFRDFLF